MDNYKMLFYLLSLLLIGHVTSQNTCESPNSFYTFKRVFLLRIQTDVTSSPQATKEDLQRSMGRCKNVTEEARKMRSFMESFGLDLSMVARNPFILHKTQDYELIARCRTKENNYRMVMASWNDAAEMMNQRVYTCVWLLTVKRDIHGPRGPLSSGTLLLFGNYRFTLGSKHECIQLTRVAPPSTGSLISVADFQLYHDVWGHGAARGSDIYTEGRGSRDGYRIFTFPPDASTRNITLI